MRIPLAELIGEAQLNQTSTDNSTRSNAATSSTNEKRVNY